MNANLHLNSNGYSLIGKVSRLLGIIVLCLYASAFQCGGNANRGWRVWIRTEPCPGRHDWLSVSKEQPGGGTTKGLGTFWQYDNFLPAQGCTEAEPFGCTFEEAKAVKDNLQFHEKLKDFCCRDYAVWRNSGTGEMTVVTGKFATAGPGWDSEKGGLCCEEAEALAGKPGVCSGSNTHGGNAGNDADTGCANKYNVYEDIQTGKRIVAKGSFATERMRRLKEGLCCKEAGDLAGIPGVCNGETSGSTK